jgi:hypothetical protein
VTFHAVYVRSGLYQTLPLPGIPGIEAAGVIEEIGSDVPDFAVGDRVAYVTGKYGAYASERILSAALAVRLPAEISEQTAATVLLKGLTAEMLVREVHRVGRGDVVLVHAAPAESGGGSANGLSILARPSSARWVARRKPRWLGAQVALTPFFTGRRTSSTGYAILPAEGAWTWPMTRSGRTRSRVP